MAYIASQPRRIVRYKGARKRPLIDPKNQRLGYFGDVTVTPIDDNGDPLDPNTILNSPIATMPGPDDNVDQLTSGSGLSSGDFNCTSFPGVCKPTNFPALDIVRTLQQQCNRIAQVKGFTKAAVDGDVGPGTVALVNKIATLGIGISGSAPTIAASADILTQDIQAAADAMGAPSSVPGPAGNPPSIITKSGKQIAAPPPNPLTDALNNLLGGMSSTQKLVLGGIGVGLVVALVGMSKKRRSR
jgi:hypothetical protein